MYLGEVWSQEFSPFSSFNKPASQSGLLIHVGIALYFCVLGVRIEKRESGMRCRVVFTNNIWLDW